MVKKYKKFVLICDSFPPAGMGYAQRVGKLCKYLPKVSNWIPHVFCGIHVPRITGEDLELAKEIPPEIQITRIPGFESSWIYKKMKDSKIGKLIFYARKLYCFPDYRIEWARKLVETAIKIYPHGDNFEVVLASGPPKSSYVAGFWLSRYWGIPLIIDLRDPWNPNYLGRNYSPIHSFIDKWCEQRIYRFASRIIANTEKNKEILLKDYPWLDGKVVSIPNGYDPDDMDPNKGPALKESSSNITIDLLYLGGVRGKVPKAGIFEEPFLWAVQKAIKQDVNLRHRLRIHFVGSDARPLLNVVEKLGLRNICIFHGKVCCNQVGRPLAEADVCVLILNSAAEGSGWIPAKTYYYLASGKPILAISPESRLTDFLRKHSTCFEVIHPKDKYGWRKFISFLNRAITEKKPHLKKHSKFSRKSIAIEIGKLLTEVSG